MRTGDLIHGRIESNQSLQKQPSGAPPNFNIGISSGKVIKLGMMASYVIFSNECFLKIQNCANKL